MTTRLGALALVLIAVVGCDGSATDPVDQSGGPPRGDGSQSCSFYDGSRLRLGESRCWKDQLYECTSSGLQSRGMGGSHPDCR